MLLDVAGAALSASSLSRALAAVICIIVGLVRFHVYFVRWLLLRLVGQNRLVTRYDVLSGMLGRGDDLAHHLILAHHDAVLQLDSVLDRRLPHHVKGLGRDPADWHRVIQVVSGAVAAFLILIVLGPADRLACERHEIRMIHAADVRANTLCLLFLRHQVVLPAILVEDELLDIQSV